ncbi:uridylate kinase [Gimesia benthica]|uniref:Uridylate kinase n=1 Tax=Gimesia benthica TaxID=2608982 RepID=A0A6I6AGD7_9PLAN|nr:uridylate kinase [Gimesia benthica]QGQ25146.1 uridylate kinase [Gimesia benthica]
MPVTVIKVGGSLFDLPDLGNRLSHVLGQLDGSRPLIVSGGGRTADLVRDWDRIHNLGEERAHWLAIQSLTLNERLLNQLLPESESVDSHAAAEAAWRANRIPILSAYAYLSRPAAQSLEQAELPAAWEVTSDSIAAWITLNWPAQELVLLKSVDPPEVETTSELCARGLVDAYFPQLADELLCLRWCNLRSSGETLQLATVTRGSSFQSRNATGPA